MAQKQVCSACEKYSTKYALGDIYLNDTLVGHCTGKLFTNLLTHYSPAPLLDLSFNKGGNLYIRTYYTTSVSKTVKLGHEYYYIYIGNIANSFSEVEMLKVVDKDTYENDY